MATVPDLMRPPHSAAMRAMASQATNRTTALAGALGTATRVHRRRTATVAVVTTTVSVHHTHTSTVGAEEVTRAQEQDQGVLLQNPPIRLLWRCWASRRPSALRRLLGLVDLRDILALTIRARSIPLTGNRFGSCSASISSSNKVVHLNSNTAVPPTSNTTVRRNSTVVKAKADSRLE